jgi:imidazolonepropionase-like amidohydrolase
MQHTELSLKQRGYAHSVEVCRDYDVPGAVPQLEHRPGTGSPARFAQPAARSNVAHAFASGVKVAFGTDAAVYPHGMPQPVHVAPSRNLELALVDVPG